MPSQVAQALARALNERFTPKPPAYVQPPGTVGEYESYQQQNPVDRLAQEMPSNWAPASKEQQAANGAQNLHGLMSVTPVVGNIVAAKDAWQSAKAVGAADNPKDRRNSMAGLLLNAAGALSPLPFGRTASNVTRGASSRTNTFAGPMAKTADHDALARAKEMTSADVPRDAIWEQTGWFKGTDGKWRFEIDDSQAFLKPWTKEHGQSNIAWPNRQGLPQELPAQKWIDHPELERAYWPTQKDSPGVLHDELPGYRGNYDPNADVVTMNHRTLLEPDGGRSTGLHELQHAVQKREGFATGGNVEEFATRENKAMAGIYDNAYLVANRVHHLGETVDEAAKYIAGARDAVGNADTLKVLAARYSPEDLIEMANKHKPSVLYKRQAGEVEARNVQARKDMTAAERRAKAPWHTQDVPDERQIVRMPRAGQPMGQMGAFHAYHGSPHDFDEFKWNDKTRGTGEGAQAYGDGLYFAQNPAVAREYRDTLSSSRTLSLDGQPIADDLHRQYASAKLRGANLKDQLDFQTRQAEQQRQIYAQRAEMGVQKPEILRLAEDHERNASAIKAVMAGKVTGPQGRVYKAEIDAEPHHLLDWDKPLAEQSEDVRAGLQRLFSKLEGKPVDDLEGIVGNYGDSGARIHELVKSYGGDQAAAAAAMREAGIPGIRFLDQGSRGKAAGGTHNYTIWDDSKIKVKSKE